MPVIILTDGLSVTEQTAAPLPYTRERSSWLAQCPGLASSLHWQADEHCLLCFNKSYFKADRTTFGYTTWAKHMTTRFKYFFTFLQGHFSKINQILNKRRISLTSDWQLWSYIKYCFQILEILGAKPAQLQVHDVWKIPKPVNVSAVVPNKSREYAS